MQNASMLTTLLAVLTVAQLAQGCSPGEENDRSRPPQRDSLSRLATLPYLQVKSPPAREVGVTYHDEKAVAPGVNLCVSLCPLRAFVINMQGNILHKWEIEVEEAWPGLEASWDAYNWRNVHLFPNGDLLAICPELGLMKVDRSSRLLWTYGGEYIAHHDLDVDDDGNIYLLTHKEITSQPGLELTGPILADYITILTPAGKEKRHLSVIDAFLKSDYAPLLDNMAKEGDCLHTNTLELIRGHHADRIPFFQKGHILISIREFSTIAVIDPRQARVIWALTGLWRWQHAPTILPNGNILLFDNCGLTNRRSRVMELDPLTQEIVWDYQGGEGRPFYSRYSGTCHRLPNGNTLIVESDNGRAFEVTTEGEIVWEFINPFRGEPGDGCGSLYEVIRLDPARLPFLAK